MPRVRYLLLTAILPVFTILAFAGTAVAGPPPPTDYYVDLADVCAGMTPCYHTIQDGVDHASGPSRVNVFPGTYTESVDLTQMGSQAGSADDDIILQTVDANGNPAAGTVTIHGANPISGITFGAAVTVDGFTLEATIGNGLHLQADGAITVRNTTADESGDGLDTDGTGDDGFDLETTNPSDGAITIENSSADGNGGQYGDGFDIRSANGVTISDSHASDNVGTADNDGFDIYDTAGLVSLTNVVASGNSEDGIWIETAGDAALTTVTTEENGVNGVTVFLYGIGATSTAGAPSGAGNLTAQSLTGTDNGLDGLHAEVSGDITVADSVFADNSDEGADLYAQSIAVTNVIASRNGEHGLRLEAADAVTIDRVTSTENGFSLPGQRDGIYVTSANVTSFFGITGTPIMTLTVGDSLLTGNAGAGLKIDNLAVAGTHVMTSTVMCDNAEGGLALYAPGATLDARGNWWGSETGPAHPDNPDGTGSVIYDGADGAAGDVMFTPWLSTGVIVVPSEVYANQPNALLVLFRSDNSDYYLENGPGSDLGYPPLSVSTLDGTVTTVEGGTGPAAVGTIADHILDFTWTPDQTGSSKVVVEGPCDLLALGGATVMEGGEPAIWGDANCSGAADPVDALLTLRHDAGLSTDTCFDLGATYEIAGASPHPWGDVDCSGGVDAIDALKVLRFDAALSVSQAADCPVMGSDVLVSELPAP